MLTHHLKHQLQFFKQLHLYLNSGFNINESLSLILHNDPPQSFISFLIYAKNAIAQGLKISSVFKSYTHLFSNFTLTMINTGETSGKLIQALEHIIYQLDFYYQIRQRLQQTLTYPTVILIVTSIIFIVMCCFIVPQFELLFRGSNIELPVITHIIFKLSNLLIHHTLLIVIFFTAILTYFIRRPRKLIQLVIYLPLFKKLNVNYKMMLIVLELHLLLAAGITLLSALTYLSQNNQDKNFTELLQQVLEQIKQGKTIVEGFALFTALPNSCQQLILMGEKTGQLEQMLAQCFKIIQHGLEAKLSMCTAMAEPLIMFIISIIMGSLILGLYLPLFNLGKLF